MENPTNTGAPAAVATATPKAKRVRKVAATPAQDTKMTDTTARDALLAKVRKGIESTQGQTPDKAIVILRETMKTVEMSCPNVEFSSNKEQRTAQLKQLRESRANLGWQVAARMVGDAIAAVEGVQVVHRYSAKPHVNGDLVATENIKTTLKSSKRHQGITIR